MMPYICDRYTTFQAFMLIGKAISVMIIIFLIYWNSNSEYFDINIKNHKKLLAIFIGLGIISTAYLLFVPTKQFLCGE